MPQKDDFLSRLQAQLRETLVRVYDFSAEGRFDEALAAVRAAQRNTLGLEPALLKRISSADLLRLLGPSGSPDLERTLVCAELLSTEFEVLSAQGEADPKQAEKALEVYLWVFGAEPGFAPYYSGRLDVLTRALLARDLGHALPSEVQGALAGAYRAAGRFDEAENWLYRWTETEPDAAREWAEAFYRGLLELSDEVLREGGLPREEVEEGLVNITSEVMT